LQALQAPDTPPCFLLRALLRPGEGVGRSVSPEAHRVAPLRRRRREPGSHDAPAALDRVARACLGLPRVALAPPRDPRGRPAAPDGGGRVAGPCGARRRTPARTGSAGRPRCDVRARRRPGPRRAGTRPVPRAPADAVAGGTVATRIRWDRRGARWGINASTESSRMTAFGACPTVSSRTAITAAGAPRGGRASPYCVLPMAVDAKVKYEKACAMLAIGTALHRNDLSTEDVANAPMFTGTTGWPVWLISRSGPHPQEGQRTTGKHPTQPRQHLPPRHTFRDGLRQFVKSVVHRFLLSLSSTRLWRRPPRGQRAPWNSSSGS
jgi:hypothetical protein